MLGAAEHQPQVERSEQHHGRRDDVDAAVVEISDQQGTAGKRQRLRRAEQHIGGGRDPAHQRLAACESAAAW